MGREIRRVPPGWEHPKTKRRNGEFGFQPMFDKSYREAAEEWDRGYREWEPRDSFRWFWEREGVPPEDGAMYRPDWTEAEATGWCLYETVSEGTPVTPVFANAEGLIAYLAERGDFWAQRSGQGGMGMERARAFVESGGWAPSFVMSAENGVQDGATAMADEAIERSASRGTEGGAR